MIAGKLECGMRNGELKEKMKGIYGCLDFGFGIADLKKD